MCALAVALALGAADASTGHARDMTGRLGLGAQLDLAPLGPTVSVRYWVSHLGLQGLFGMAAVKSKPGEHGFVEWRPGGRVLYALTRTRLTNLFVGGGLSALLRTSKDRGGEWVYFDTVLGLEYHVSDALGLSGQLTFAYNISTPEKGLLAHDLALGGAFHFYF